MKNVLSRFELEPRFQFILTCDDVREGKPNPEIYLRAAQRFGLSAEQMLVLEDSQNGCRAAVASGAYAVAVPGGHSRQSRFQRGRLSSGHAERTRGFMRRSV